MLCTWSVGIVSGYLPANHFLEQKIVSYPHLCDPEYVINTKKDWIDMDPFKPIALPWVLVGGVVPVYGGDVIVYDIY